MFWWQIINRFSIRDWERRYANKYYKKICHWFISHSSIENSIWLTSDIGKQKQASGKWQTNERERKSILTEKYIQSSYSREEWYYFYFFCESSREIVYTGKINTRFVLRFLFIAWLSKVSRTRDTFSATSPGSAKKSYLLLQSNNSSIKWRRRMSETTTLIRNSISDRCWIEF